MLGYIMNIDIVNDMIHTCEPTICQTNEKQ